MLMIAVSITIAFYSYFRIESSNSVMTDKTRRPGETLRLFTETEKPQPITLFLFLADTREHGNKAISGLSPCWDHVIHVVQSRNIPLDPKDVKKKKKNSTILKVSKITKV